MLFCCHMRVVGVAERAIYLNEHKKWVTSKRNDTHTYTKNTIFEPFRGSDDVSEFEQVEGQIISTLRTHIFTFLIAVPCILITLKFLFLSTNAHFIEHIY